LFVVKLYSPLNETICLLKKKASGDLKSLGSFSDGVCMHGERRPWKVIFFCHDDEVISLLDRFFSEEADRR
jgi:hypothetical protein